MEEFNLQKTINEVYDTLPDKIQKAITDSGWENKIRAIGKRYDLVIGEAAVLETQTFLVMLGLKKVTDYRQNLENEIKIPKEKMDGIIKNVEEQIFKDIRKTLMNVTSEIESEEKIREENQTQSPSSETNQAPESEITKQSINDEIGDEIEILDEEVKPDPIRESFIEEKLKNESIALKEDHEMTEGSETKNTVGADKGNTQTNNQLPTKEFDPYREPIDLDDVEI